MILVRIYLRPLREDDAGLIVKWRNTEEVAAHCFDKSPITLESHINYYNQYIKTGKNKQFIVERIEEFSGVVSYPIATVYLKDIDKINRRCELCIFTSNDAEWNCESQSIAIGKLLEKSKEEFCLHKVYSYVFVNNSDEVELLESAGFIIEALLKSEAVSLSGQYCDVYRMSIIFE